MLTYHQIIEKAENWYSQKLPFVLFSFPDNDKLFCLFQDTREKFTTKTFDAHGFIMAPFDYNKEVLIIPSAKATPIIIETPETTEHPEGEVDVANKLEGKQEYIDLINDAIGELQSTQINKVVLSRKKDIPLSSFTIKTLANQIFTKTYYGLKFLWYHPETDIWCGTTPENLLHLKETSFSTTSLAGTKKAEDVEDVNWTDKEIEEQAIVTNTIFDSLQNITPVLKVSKPYTHRAGSLVHLKTDVTGVIRKSKAHLEKFIDALHPTPAVCGAPFKDAKKYILENEKYNREFYTGFLGNIKCDEVGSNLYVNLRSMKIKDNVASIFVGGGILKESVAEDEWEETQNKLQTMLKVVAPML